MPSLNHVAHFFDVLYPSPIETLFSICRHKIVQLLPVDVIFDDPSKETDEIVWVVFAFLFPRRFVPLFSLFRIYWQTCCHWLWLKKLFIEWTVNIIKKFKYSTLMWSEQINEGVLYFFSSSWHPYFGQTVYLISHFGFGKSRWHGPISHHFVSSFCTRRFALILLVLGIERRAQRMKCGPSKLDSI